MSADSTTAPILPINILVTGSRVWPYVGILRGAIDEIRLRHPKSPIVIMHGACPTGADLQADDYARFLHIPVDQHRADWHTYGRAAGPIRNREMVTLLGMRSMPVCLAFVLDGSRGATGTLEMVRRAGLPWRLYSAVSRNPGRVNYSDWRGRTMTLDALLSPGTVSYDLATE